MRNLKLVWEDEKAQKEKFGPSNTLMIDSEAFKVRKHKENSIVIQPYTLDQVMNGGGDDLSILTQCKDYVIKLLNEAEDVQEYLAQNKFEFDDTEPQMAVMQDKVQKAQQKKAEFQQSEVFLKIQKEEEEKAKQIIESMDKLDLKDEKKEI